MILIMAVETGKMAIETEEMAIMKMVAETMEMVLGFALVLSKSNNNSVHCCVNHVK